MSKAGEYAAKFNRVFDYIDQNLHGDLSLDSLSQVAHFSKFHFSRQFSGYTGVSVFGYVQLMRLKRASYRLAFNQADKIIDIALDAGFENPESFSRAFKNTFGQTPTEFRLQPAWQPWNEQYQFPKRERNTSMDVRIIQFEETKIASFQHRGAPNLVNDSVAQFIAWRKQSGLSPIKQSSTFGIVHDNPDTTEPDKFRFDPDIIRNEANNLWIEADKLQKESLKIIPEKPEPELEGVQNEDQGQISPQTKLETELILKNTGNDSDSVATFM